VTGRMDPWSNEDLLRAIAESRLRTEAPNDPIIPLPPPEPLLPKPEWNPTPVQALRALRYAATQKRPLFFEFDKITGPARGVVADLLERTFTPATWSADQAVVAWEKSPSDTTAKRAIEMLRVPGTDRRLWDRIESMQSWEVVSRLDRAILKAK